jgi:hypothetical protein
LHALVDFTNQPIAENVSSSEFTFTLIYCDNYYGHVRYKPTFFQFLYRGTTTEIIIVTINVQVNSEDDTFLQLADKSN